MKYLYVYIEMTYLGSVVVVVVVVVVVGEGVAVGLGVEERLVLGEVEEVGGGRRGRLGGWGSEEGGDLVGEGAVVVAELEALLERLQRQAQEVFFQALALLDELEDVSVLGG